MSVRECAGFGQVASDQAPEQFRESSFDFLLLGSACSCSHALSILLLTRPFCFFFPNSNLTYTECRFPSNAPLSYYFTHRLPLISSVHSHSFQCIYHSASLKTHIPFILLLILYWHYQHCLHSAPHCTTVSVAWHNALSLALSISPSLSYAACLLWKRTSVVVIPHRFPSYYSVGVTKILLMMP